jgi:hypothetical protein
VRSDSDLHEPRTNAEQSETADDFRVSFESHRPFTGVIAPELPVGSPERDELFREFRRTFAEDWKAAKEAVKRERRERKGDLYFVRVGRFLKIGRTTNIGARMRMIQCHAPTPPELVGMIAKGGWQEADWHQDFRHLRSNGEWFRITPELKAAVNHALEDGKR